MIREQVNSSSVRSMGYDPVSRTLEIEFHSSGFVYRYLDVPSRVFNELRAAPSIGRYVANSIKGKFASEKMLF